MRLRTAALILVFLFASVPIAVAQAIADTRASDRARGLVYRGMERARPDGPCKTGWELQLPNGKTSCTHGPDLAPSGVDVTKERPLHELAAFSGDVAAEAADGDTSKIYCDGDGVAGNRVQAVYAYSSDRSSNYASVVPYIRYWAAVADDAINQSAARDGGVRHVRWVTTPDCQLDVMEVALSPAGVASLSGTVSEFRSLGLDRADRKYVVWADAYVYCGVANVSSDDSPAQDNINNGPGRPGMIARIDRGCWGRSKTPLEVHELVHTLGGVQTSAPNGAGLYHCADEADVMCYDDDGTSDGYVTKDGGLVPIRTVCPSANERLLDCNGDDYFNVDPEQGSWLANHWNVANSSFLTADGPVAETDRTAPRPTAPRPLVIGRLGRGVSVRLSWTSEAADVAGYWLWMKVDRNAWRYVERPDLWANFADVQVRRGHRYRFLVHAFDSVGNASRAVLGPAFRPRVLQERHRAVSYSGRWERQFRPDASRQHVAVPTAGPVGSRLSFRGKAIAWVSSTSLDGGVADVYVDGRYVRTVSLASDVAAEREVVFSHRFRYRGLHRIAVQPLAGPVEASVDAFVVLR